MNPTSQLVADIAARTLRPPPPMTVSEWADAHRSIADRNAALPGRWRTSFAPHLRAIMDAFGDPKVRRISICKPTQCGGTEAVLNMALYAIDRKPGNVFWVWSNIKNAQDFSTDRLADTIRACPLTARHISERKRDTKGAEIRLDNMTIRLRGSPINGSAEQNLESWSAMYVFNDEIDRCSPDTPEVMKARVSAFPHTHKMVDLGSPGASGVGIDKLVSESAGAGLDYWAPCPSCGFWFVPDFSMVMWLPGANEAALLSPTGAWLRCPNTACGRSIYGHECKPLMSRGVWAPDHDDQLPPMEQVLPSQERIDSCLHAPHVGFRVNEFCDPHSPNPFGKVAAVFIKNGEQRTEKWMNHQRGKPWSPSGKSLKDHELLALCTLKEAGGYSLRTVPRGALLLTTSIDVQEREAWVLVRGWGLHGGESFLVHTERVDLPGGDLRALDKCVGWSFALDRGWCDHNGETADSLAPTTPTHMRSALTCIDSGDGDRTLDVYSWVMRHGGAWNLVFPVKGQAGGGSDKPQWVRKLDTLPNGAALPKNGAASPELHLLNVNTNLWKTWLFERLGGAGRGIVGGVGLGGDLGGGGRIGACVFRYPEAVNDPGVDDQQTSRALMRRYFSQVTAEEQIEKISRSTGRRVKLWQPRTGAGGGRANHFLDCEVYNAAVTAQRSMMGQHITKAFGLCRNDPTPPVAAPSSPPPSAPRLTSAAPSAVDDRRDDGRVRFASVKK